MRNKITLGAIALFAGASVLFFNSDDRIASFTNGAPGSNSGSPGDGKDCTMCHSAITPENKEGIISTNIPETGYVNGETYTVTVAYSGTTTKYGFEISAEATDNSKAGTFASGTGSQIASSNVTHDGGGTSFPDMNANWEFTWTAPETDVDSVTFYAAVVEANGENQNSDDPIYLTNHGVKRNISVGIETMSNSAFRFGPNPASDFVNFSLPANVKEVVVAASIFDVTGKRVIEEQFEVNSSNTYSISDLSEKLTTGMYVLKVNAGEFVRSSKLMIN